jgi:metal-dependent amidase/aminoacylase/carboxypeptidase family protein
MIEEGVLEKYPVGMHNWPEPPIGRFAIQLGPMMAAFDILQMTINLQMTIKGCGGHAAMPHFAVDAILPLGASYWARLEELALAKEGAGSV